MKGPDMPGAVFGPADRAWMGRAIELARMGAYAASPNPMVGAVVVADGRIIGEGYHRRWGGPHAEVNAIESVTDKSLLPRATVYVTLEPCAHWGKTPPCALLLVRSRVRRVVIGVRDPFARVDGRGIAILREAGIDVEVGCCHEECLRLIERFYTAHTLRRPFTVLKWACSADGFTDCQREAGEPAPRFSTAVSRLAVMQMRADANAIMVGADTVINDNPRLTVAEGMPGRSPARVVVDRRQRVSAQSRVFADDGTAVYYFTGPAMRGDLPSYVRQVTTSGGSFDGTARSAAEWLYSEAGYISLLVEGGMTLHRSLLADGLWDEVREERAPIVLGPAAGRAEAPALPQGVTTTTMLGPNTITTVRRQPD